jgi:hypothetical protein
VGDPEEPPHDSSRPLVLYPVTDDEVRTELHRHRRFEAEVGMWRDPKPPESAAAFYADYERRPPRDYSTREPEGWFVWEPPPTIG